MASTPSAMACLKEAKVFSNSIPAAPRCPMMVVLLFDISVFLKSQLYYTTNMQLSQ